MTSRGVSFWRDAQAPAGSACAERIVFASIDARLFAIDAHDGKRCAGFGDNGEVDFTMSYNQSEAANKVRQGVFPATARPLLLRDGTLANSHYLGIPFDAPNPAGAMVVANFLLSPDTLARYAEPEVAPEYHERIAADWRRLIRSQP